MSLLYLDHHILVNEAFWPAIDRLVKQRHLTLALSSWSVQELRQANDVKQKVARGRFLESLAPVYMHGMDLLQRAELRRFVYDQLFGVTLQAIAPFCNSFAELLREDFGLLTRPEYSLSEFLENSDQGNLDLEKREHAEALRTIQKASKKQLDATERATFFQHLANLAPKHSPDGRILTPAAWVHMLELCYANKDALYRTCPALFAEDRLGIKRAEDPNRNPRLSDSADLMHAAVAMSYCEYFVSNDAFLVKCCAYVSAEFDKREMPCAGIKRSLEELF